MNPQGNLGNIDPEGMAALREALERRSQGDQMPAMDTQSSSSPTASPLPPEASGGISALSGAETGMGFIAPQGNPEARLIIGALKDRLKSLSVMEGGIPPKISSGGMV